MRQWKNENTKHSQDVILTQDYGVNSSLMYDIKPRGLCGRLSVSGRHTGEVTSLFFERFVVTPYTGGNFSGATVVRRCIYLHVRR
jgi:hypothetical protein